jgi:TPR repeat protein
VLGLLGVPAPAPALADVVLPPAIAHSPRLQDLRRSMLAGRNLSDVQLRTLADAGDGLAAARYARRLEERDDQAFVDDAAHYYSIAVYTGREFAVPRLLATVASPEAEFSAARLRNIRSVLERAARRGDAGAAAGLADLFIQGAPFGQDIERARELLLAAAEAGDSKAAIRLAVSLIEGAPGLPPAPGAALHPLALALASPDPGVQAMALTLGRQISAGVQTGAPASATAPATAMETVLPASRPEPAPLEGPAP